MKADTETSGQIRESAARLVEIAKRKFGLDLDYSETSLVVADDLITCFFKDQKPHWVRAAVFMGAYLGEVIIQNLGGKWQSDLSLRKVGHTKSFVHPLNRAYKRLAYGLQDSLVSYYRSLKISTCQDGAFEPSVDILAAARRRLRDGCWDWALLNRLLDESEPKSVREDAADALGRMGDAVIVAPLLEALASPDTALYAAIALQGLPDDRAFDPLLALVGSATAPALKMQAALALGALKRREAGEALVALLDDEDEMVAYYGSLALAKMGEAAPLDALLEVVGGQRPGRRVYALEALEGLADPRAVPALIEALFATDEEVREAAAKALQYVPDSRAFEPLTRLLKDPSYRTRTLAAYALANIDGGSSLPYLKPLLKDEVQSVRLHAAQLMEWLEAGVKPPVKCE